MATLEHSNGCPDENDVLAFVEGGLEAGVRTSVEAHLATCGTCRRLLEAFGADPPAPEVLGRYAIRRELGRGGMGVVYAAHDPELDREVAVKALHADRRRSAQRNALLVREAAAMAKLNHPNAVQVFDVGTAGDRVFIAMELIDGNSLRDRLNDGPLPWPRARAILLDVAAGVAAAHGAGIVHRDLKPGNVLLRADGRAVVTDFGLAGWDDAEGVPTQSGPAPLDRSRPTLRAAGTPVYMAPEQHRGEPSDVRTDIFAFCTLGYEIVYGTVPFTGGNAADLLARKLEGELQPPRQGDAPGWVRGVLARGLAADPDARWPDMLVLRQALRRGPRRRALWVLLPILGAIGLFALADAEGADPGCDGAEALRARWAAARPELAWHFDHLDAAARDPARGVAERAIDTYVADWVSACEDPGLDRRARDERQACLAAGQAALGSLFASLRERDAELVYRIDVATRSLPPPYACGSERREGAPPEALEEEVRIRRDLAQSITLMHLGQYDRSATALDGLADAAHDSGAAWLEANVLLQQARLGLNRGLLGEVTAPAEAAYSLAAEHGETETEGGAALVLAMASCSLGRPDDAQRWLRHATAAYERLPVADARRAELHRAGLRVAQLRNDLDAALAHGEKALAAAGAEAGPTSWGMVEPLNDLANIDLLRRDMATARERVEQGLELVNEAYGATHPQVALLRTTMANVELYSGNVEAGIENLRAADKIFARTMEPTEGHRLLVQTNLGNLELVRKHWAAGREALLPLLAKLKANYGESGEGYIGALSNVAAAELELQMYPSARARFEEVLRLRTARDGETTAPVAEAMMHVGLVDLAEGDLDSAQRKLEDARALYVQAAGPDHPPIAAALEGLGRIALARGDKKRAADLARKGIALRKDEELERLLQLAEE